MRDHYFHQGYGVLIWGRENGIIPGYLDWQLEDALDYLELMQSLEGNL